VRTRGRVVRTALALTLLSLLAAGCAKDKGGGSETAQPSTTQPDTPVRGGTLVVALDGGDPGSLNPAVTSNGGVHTASEPMFNGLVGLDKDGKPTPELAESWTIEQNGAVYRFKLRSGVKFHDGSPFTSDDVKFTFEQALLKFHSRTSASLTAAKVAITAPDPLTVVFTFPAPYAPLLQQLNVTEAPIIPKKVYEPCGGGINTVAGCPANKTPVGTGPFKFVSYDTTEIKMARNPDYFRSGLPYLDNLTERFITDAGTRTLALQKHEVDWAWTIQGPDLATVKADKGLTTGDAARGPGGGNCILTVAFNLKPPAGRTNFFADVRVRQALWGATNRQQGFDTVLFGQGKIATQPINTAIAVAKETTPVALPLFDVGRAKTLLDQAGWVDQGGTRVAKNVPGVPDGTPFKIDYHGFVGQQIDYGQALKQMWKAVGVDVETKQEDNPTLSANVFRDRQFDTSAISYCNEADPLIGVRRQYHSSQISQTAFTNASGYSTPEMDALWDQSTTEADPIKRQAIFQKIQELAVKDLPYIWLAETVNTRAWNAQCTGFNLQNTGLFAEAAYCKR